MNADRFAQSLLPPQAPRLEALLAQMTLREKLGQMTQRPFYGTSEALEAAVAAGELGSLLNVHDLEIRNRLQHVAVEQSRCKIPLVFGRDVIHGHRTILPIPLGQSASFNPALVEQAAHVAASEAREAGIDWTFAPMVDVTRDPRWGRVAESPGEDPVLAAAMGAAMVRGFQGDDPSCPDRVAACVKHFVGYGASEAGKDYNTTWIPEQLLREHHLPAFKACVEAGVLSLMSAFNDLNGIPASGNQRTLREILKTEWGFSGMVVSDWASTFEMIAHGYCADEKDVVKKALAAGVDMEMASETYLKELSALVEDGTLPLALVDDAVRRILSFKLSLGLFERPYTERTQRSVVLSERHKEVAQELAAESLVLLKNHNATLPLPIDLGRVLLVGPLADSGKDQLGCWAFDGDVPSVVTVKAALQARLGASRLDYEATLPDSRSSDTSGFSAALQKADKAEYVVAVLGEDSGLSGECHSRAFLSIPGAQLELLKVLKQAGKPLVLVVFSGRPLLLEEALQAADAVLFAWHPGTMGGAAITDVLFGRSPSGKLPISFPRAVGQIPIYHAHKRTGRPPKDPTRGIPSGTPLDPTDFDASYIDLEVTPQFPFGFGLGYTQFSFSDLKLAWRKAPLGATLGVSARVKNVGAAAGTTVAQLYLCDRAASVTRPVRELKAFQRVTLEPSDSQELRFELSPEALSFVGESLTPTLEAGMFDVFLGEDSTATLSASFELTE